MWSRPVACKVMTDSSESQVAVESGTAAAEESSTSITSSVSVAVEGGGSSGAAASAVTIHSRTNASGGNSTSCRRPSACSVTSVQENRCESDSATSGGGGSSGPVICEGTGATCSAASTNFADSRHHSRANYVVGEDATSEVASTSTAPSQNSSTSTTASSQTGSDRLTSPPPLNTGTSATAATAATVTTSSTTTPTPTNPAMSGNSDYHSASRSSGPNNNSSSSSSSSSRRQRNGLFGINLDLNFDPSSWLVPGNVAGRSISSLSVLPDWVRHPVSIIPNRGADNSTSSQSSSGLAEGRQSQQQHHHHHHYGSSSSGGAASRLVSHHHPSQSGGGGGGSAAPGTSWNSSSFQTSSSIPSNMHHHHHQHPHHGGVPLRTRHGGVASMRSVDEDLDSDYNPVSTIDIGATGRGGESSYVIDMDSPMGGWAEDDGPSSHAVRGTSGGGTSHANNPASSDATHHTTASGSSPGGGDNGAGARRSISDINLPPGGVPGPAQGIPGAGGTGAPGGGPDGNSPPMSDAATGANERTRAAEILRDAPETRAFINEISRYTTIRPFIVINFLKGVFDHGTSILAFLALVVTFSHANSMVKKEVSKQRKRNLLYLTMIVINLMACVAFIYYIFNEMELYFALVFMPTGSDLSAFWSLMWAVGVTDYVAKFGTVFVKIVVVALPGCVVPFQKRGKFYLFIEYSSQLYRSFLPVYPWLIYLVSAYEGTARMFGLLLAGIYVIFKITDSVKRFKDWLKALEKLLSNVHYGTNPTAKQLDGAGTICPICHDNFANPTRLQCSHIFCEECVATWFDRERTCPMCRAKVVDDPTYRDGSTSQYIQLF